MTRPRIKISVKAYNAQRQFFEYLQKARRTIENAFFKNT